MCSEVLLRKEFQQKAEKKFQLDEQKIWETTEKACFLARSLRVAGRDLACDIFHSHETPLLRDS